MGKRDLSERLEQIEAFFQDISIEEFEKKLLDCGLGTICDSSRSDYVLATDMKYRNQMKSVINTKDNKFFLVAEDETIKGAA